MSYGINIPRHRLGKKGTRYEWEKKGGGSEMHSRWGVDNSTVLKEVEAKSYNILQ